MERCLLSQRSRTPVQPDNPFTSIAQQDSPHALQDLLLRLLLATLYGACVAAVFKLTHGRRKADASILVTTLVLLSILVAMVSMVIGNSVAQAFALVGALSIVRFRTVVEDTRDTVFVIFAVIVGMAAGAGLLLVPLIGIPIVAVVAIVLSRVGNGTTNLTASESTLAVRLALGRDPEKLLGGVLRVHLESFRLMAVDTARQGAALDVKYAIRLRSAADVTALVSELNQVEGVQSVELRM
jgi:uncharacterized membrane protein YhiD involved in acid resistance